MTTRRTTTRTKTRAKTRAKTRSKRAKAANPWDAYLTTLWAGAMVEVQAYNARREGFVTNLLTIRGLLMIGDRPGATWHVIPARLPEMSADNRVYDLVYDINRHLRKVLTD